MLISLAVNQNIYHCKRFKKSNWKRKSNKFVSLYRSPIKTHAKIFIITVATVKCYHARLETDHSNLYTLNIKIWTKSNQNKNQTNLYPFIVLLQNTHTYIYIRSHFCYTIISLCMKLPCQCEMFCNVVFTRYSHKQPPQR